jgi:hypothetical protein
MLVSLFIAIAATGATRFNLDSAVCTVADAAPHIMACVDDTGTQTITVGDRTFTVTGRDKDRLTDFIDDI